jgi:hypothetical protein
VLDKLGNPDAVTLANLATEAGGAFQQWLLDRKNRRAIPHRLEQCGYLPVRNQDAKDGLWKVNAARQVVYARAELSIRDRLVVVRSVTDV